MGSRISVEAFNLRLLRRRGFIRAITSFSLVGCLSRDNEGETGGNRTQPQPKEGSKDESHPSVESQLYGLTTTDDPQTYADQHGIKLEDQSVKVTLELRNERAEIPPEAEVTNRYQDLADAWVRIDDIVTVAEYKQVTFVRLPRETVSAVRGEQPNGA